MICLFSGFESDEVQTFDDGTSEEGSDGEGNDVTIDKVDNTVAGGSTF